ncbi:cell division protein FtsQ/DivIB [Pauljensenia sp. 27098_8_107]
MRPPSPRRPGGARSPEEEPSRVEEAASSFDEIVSPSADEEAQEPKRRSASLTQRRRARMTVDRPMPVADAASLLGGEEATDLGDRLRERTRARRILLARRIALTFVTLALAAGGVWVAFFSPVFAFSSSAVVVSGEDGTLVTADSVRSSIASFEGVPLTRLNTQAVARAVESNVAVRSASVSRRWPTSLRVSVTMRTGMAVEAASGGYWLVDDQGIAFQQVPSAGEYPLATLPEDRATGAADIASVLGALDEATRAQVSAVTSTGTQVNFTLRGGQTVKWGTRGDAPQKARVLATLLANVQASTYDVSSPNHPVTS